MTPATGADGHSTPSGAVRAFGERSLPPLHVDTARLPELLLLDDGGRKPDGEGGPVILGRGGGVDVDAAAMGLDDGQGDRHAQPR